MNLKWTPEQVMLLRQHYPQGELHVIINATNFTLEQLDEKAARLGLKRPRLAHEQAWSEREDVLLKGFYPTHNNVEVQKQLGGHRSLAAIRGRAQLLRLKKLGFYWTPEEELFLIDHYYSSGRAWTAEELERTPNAVSLKAADLRKRGLLMPPAKARTATATTKKPIYRVRHPK